MFNSVKKIFNNVHIIRIIVHHIYCKHNMEKYNLVVFPFADQNFFCYRCFQSYHENLIRSYSGKALKHLHFNALKTFYLVNV
jgi:hypothetical protein